MADGDRPKQNNDPEKPRQLESKASCQSREELTEENATQPRAATHIATSTSTTTPDKKSDSSLNRRSTPTQNQESSATQTTASKSPVGSGGTSLSDDTPSSSDKQFSSNTQSFSNSLPEQSSDISVSDPKPSNVQDASPSDRNPELSSTSSRRVPIADNQPVASANDKQKSRRKPSSRVEQAPPLRARPIARPYTWAFQQPATHPTLYKSSTRISEPSSSSKNSTSSAPSTESSSKPARQPVTSSSSPTSSAESSKPVQQPVKSSLSSDGPTWISSSSPKIDKTTAASKPDPGLRKLTISHPKILVPSTKSQGPSPTSHTKWWAWTSTTKPPSPTPDLTSSPSPSKAPPSRQTDAPSGLTERLPLTSPSTRSKSKLDSSSSAASTSSPATLSPPYGIDDSQGVLSYLWNSISTSLSGSVTSPSFPEVSVTKRPRYSSPAASTSSPARLSPPDSIDDSQGVLSYLWNSISTSLSGSVMSPSFPEVSIMKNSTPESNTDSSPNAISHDLNLGPPSKEKEGSLTIWVPWGEKISKSASWLPSLPPSDKSPSLTTPIPTLLPSTSSSTLKPSGRRTWSSLEPSTAITQSEVQVRRRSYSSSTGSPRDIVELFPFGLFESDTYEGMAPPYYADLGKKANDVFSKGYHFGVFKLDLKTKSESGVEFASGITSNQESGKVFGSLSSKYAVKDYGLTFTEKWNTDNTLATDITIQDQIAAGLKITLEGTFAPQTGSKTGKLKTSFANETVAVNTNLDLDLAGPIMDVAAVLNYQGWLAGVHGQFDSQKAKFSKNNFALGYQSNDFSLHTNVDNGKDFGGSIYQKVSEKIDCGISMKWTAGSADTLFGVGAKFALDADASLHAKINNKSLIGLGYQQKLRPGVTLTLSAAIDGQNFNAGGHKVGVALELEP